MSIVNDPDCIVVKVGTSTLTYDTGKLNISRMERLVRTLSDIQNSGKKVLLVTSAAIAVGVSKLGLKERPRDTKGKQAAAAVGQCELMYVYDKLFSEYSQKVAQVLLTRDVVDDEHRKGNVINTLEALMDMNVIPIINENDTVAIDELDEFQFGDNDTLSAVVASIVDADMLILLSDIDGLYNSDPRLDPNASLISEVYEINDDIRSLCGAAGTSRGTGGMITKISAAQICSDAGINMVIANGQDPTLIYDILDGKKVGTVFIAKKK